MQEAAFFYRAATLPRLQLSAISVATAVGSARTGRGQMWDVLGERVLRADGSDADVRRFAGFGKGVVAGVKVFALLEVVNGQPPATCWGVAMGVEVDGP